MSLQNDVQEKKLLRWGGLSGLIAGIFFALAFAFVIVFLSSEPESLKGWVTRFPAIEMKRVIENLLYLSALLFAVPLFLTLYQALKDSHLPAALFGSALSVLGISSMAIFATPHVAHSKISQIYETMELSVREQETVALMWQSTWGIFDAGLYIGFFIYPIGFILLGLAMFKAEKFGKGTGITSLVLGILGFASGFLQIADAASPAGAITYFMLIFFCFIFGIKVLKVSRL